MGFQEFMASRTGGKAKLGGFAGFMEGKTRGDADFFVQQAKEKRQKEERSRTMQDQLGQSLADYEDATGGVRGWLNKFLGRGTSKPVLAGETPEYTTEREKSEADVSRGPVSRIASVPGAVKDLMTEGAQKTAFDVFEQKKLDEQAMKRMEENNQRILDYAERVKQAQGEQKARLENIMQVYIDQNEEIASQVGGDLRGKTTQQLIGQSIETALDLTPFLGFQSILGRVGARTATKLGGRVGARFLGKTTTKPLGREVVKEAGSFGALMGGATGMQQEDATIGDIAKSTAVGGALGVGLGLGMLGLSKGATRLLEKKVVNRTKPLIEKEVGKLDTDEASLLTEGIREGRTKDQIVAEIKQVREADDVLFKEMEAPEPVKPKTEVKTPPKTESPLIQEAKKYKSAEEFVKKQTPVYHGSKTELSQFNNKQGTFFTDSYEDATGYAGNLENVYEGYLDFKKPLIIDAKGAKWDELNTKWGKSTQEIISNAQKDGYDGVTFKNIVDNVMDTAGIGESTVHYAYKPRASFVNESQLTDIWNKENTKIDPLIQEAKKYKSAEEFVKAQEKTGEKSDIFKEFKKNVDIASKERFGAENSNRLNNLNLLLKEATEGNYKNIYIKKFGERYFASSPRFGGSGTITSDISKDALLKKLPDTIQKEIKNFEPREFSVSSRVYESTGDIPESVYNNLKNYIDKLEVKELDLPRDLSIKEKNVANEIAKVWEINNATSKGYKQGSKINDVLYEYKNIKLESIVRNVLDNRGKYPNINIGMRDNILYFDIKGKQISFHGFAKESKNIPEYTKEWVGKSVFNPLTKTKSQLTDIWNKSQPLQEAKKTPPKTKVIEKKETVKPKETPKPKEAVVAKRDEAFSTHYEKIKQRLDSEGVVTIDKINIKEEAKKAFDYAGQNPKKALRIAYGLDKTPQGINAQALRASMIESLISVGKTSQAQRIAKIASKEFSKSAQDLNIAKLDIMSAGTRRIEGVIRSERMEAIGKKIPGKIPAKERAQQKITSQAKKAAKEVQTQLRSADDLLKQLTC